MIIIDLIYNLSVLVALSVLSGFINSRYDRNTLLGKILQGILFGGVAIICMLYPFKLTEGIIFDGRSIVISLSTLFFGPISGLISSILAVIFRNYLGGGGTLMGSLLITASFLIGYLFHTNAMKGKFIFTKKGLYFFGLLVTAAMMGLMLTLPSKYVLEAYKQITVTVMVFYPLITMLLGKVLLDQEENKKYLERINQEKEIYRTTFYSIGDGVITTDINGNVKQMNHVAEELTGWNETEALGKRIEDIFRIINEATRIKVENPIHKVLKEGVIVGLANHTVLISKDDIEIPIADSGAPIRDEQGKIEGVVLVFRNKSEEHKAEKLIHQSRARLNRAELASKAGNWELHLDTKMMIASEGAAKIYGVDWEEMNYEVVKKVPLPQYRQMMDNALKNLIEKNEAYDIEYKIKTVDTGEIKDIHSVAEYDSKNKILFGVIQDITFRKQTEEILRESEERFRFTFEFASIGKSLTSIDGKLINVNEAFSKMLGYSKEELAEINFLEITHPDDLEISKESVRKLLSGETGAYSFEKRYIKKDGSVIWTDVNTALFKDINGNPVHFISHVTDITERKKLEQSRFQLLNIIEKSLNEIYVFDSTTLKFEYVNQGALENLGYTYQEMSDLTPVDIKPEYSEETFRQAVHPLVTGENEKLVFETYHRRKNGSDYPVEIHLQLHKLDNNKSVFFAIINDITERKRARAALRENEAFLNNLIETIPIPIFFKDKTGKYIGANKAFASLFGYTKEQFIGKGLFDLYPSELAEIYFAKDLELFENHDIQVYESKFMDSSGGSHDIIFHKAAFTNDKGEIAGLIGAMLDITERKHAEEALQESQALYYSFIEQLPNAVFRKDKDGRYILVNNQFCKLKGLVKEDFLGKKPNEVASVKLGLQGEQGPATKYANTGQDLHAQILKTGKSFYTEEEYPLPDGSKQFMHVVRMPVYDFKGTIIGTQGIMFDITERKSAEKALRQSEEKFKQLVWDMQVGVLLQGPKAEILLSNPKSLELLGLTEDQIMGQTSFDSSWNVIHEDGSPFPGSTHPVPQAIATRKSIRNVIMGVYRPTSKNRVWLLVDAEPQLNEDGTVKHVICTFINITERRQAEEALRESEERHRTTLYSIGDGVIATDNHGLINQMNPIAENLTGWSEFEAKNKPLEEVFKIVNETTRNTVENPVNKVLQEGKIVGLANHTLLIAKNGTEIPIADSGAPIRNENGDIEGVVLVFRDQLKERAAQKVLEESEAQLRQSQRVARIGYYIFDIKNNVWSSSVMLDELFGIDRNYKRNAESWLNLVHPEYREEMTNYLTNHILKEKNEFNKEYKVLRANDNATLWVYGLGSLEFDENGSPIKMFGTIQDITERKKAQYLIETSLKEKEILLKEIHHRVKNNFQRIISLIALQTGLIEDEKILGIFDDLQNRLRTMSLIHELMYGTGDFAGVDVKNYLERLTDYLIKTYSASGKVKLNLDLESHSLDLDTIIPCGLITNEVITNSLKYAFPNSAEGNINISFKKLDDEFFLTFSDNGIGIKNKIDFENINSLGLRLVDLLTKQLKGKLEVVQPEKGLQFIIRFKGES